MTGPVAAFVYEPMQQACRESLAKPPSAWDFKSDARYQQILEHLVPELAVQVLDAVPQQFPDLAPTVFDQLPRIADENDSVGQPTLFRFSEHLKCSPSNMRYLWHALLFLRHLRSVGMDRPHVIEIGAGYGGLALYVHRLADLFNIEVARYTTVDLPEMAAIQAGYARELGIPLSAIYGSDADAIAAETARPDAKVLFSAYAFAEFDQTTQDWYRARILPFCVHGFIVWNEYQWWQHRPPNPLYDFMERPFHVEDDNVPDYRSRGWHMRDVSW